VRKLSKYGLAAAVTATAVFMPISTTPALAAATDNPPNPGKPLNSGRINFGDGVDACFSGRICFWNGTDFHEDDSSHPIGFFDSVPIRSLEDKTDDISDMGKLISGFGDSGAQDEFSSVLNKGQNSWCLYADNNFQGDHVQVNGGDQIPDLGKIQPNIAEKVSSVKRGAC
jgi:hypothetical protein